MQPNYFPPVFCVRIAATALAVFVSSPIFAQDSTSPGADSSQTSSAEEAVSKSHELVREARSLKIIQSQVQRMTRLAGGKSTGSAMVQSNLSTFTILNGPPMVVELDTKDPSGKRVTAIRRGRSVVIKIDSEPWQLPSGQYAQFKQSLADPFTCPLPEPGKSGPRWRYVGTGVEQGETCDIVESVGDWVLNYVKKRMDEGMSQASLAPEVRPIIQVESYVSRHWLSKRTGKRLRVDQSGHVRMTMHQPSTAEFHAQMEITTRSEYLDYDTARISIPPMADEILSQGD